ncbi:heme NO-binding domain-containing protein [Coralloluteibacterium thermophilus]|uniref:heme NO-binding domain-containing protein n=1 Tax=Coralloluteibacterium thermophilum TaxID=2707049 RepID=UPI00366FF441
MFTEFLDFVAAGHGEEALERVIEEAALDHGGAYTAIGLYDADELRRLAAALAACTGREADALLLEFGTRLGAALIERYPQVFAGHADLFDLLCGLGGHIRDVLHMLDPQADAPVFRGEVVSPARMRLDYRSSAPLPPLAQGLVLAAAAHYGTPVSIVAGPAPDARADVVRFDIRRR